MLEIDEGNQFARGHPGIHVVPAVLAAAEELGSSGADVLLAIALGYEIGSRIGIASKLRVTMHPHGTWGTVGAAVAVAKLHGADAEQMAEVINVASTLGLATSRRTMLEGGTVRNSFAGFSNEIGLRAWDMVDAGFVGEADGIGTVYGTVIADQFQPEEMIADLGTRWEIARNYFKRHAACRYNHGALDALQRLVAEAGGRLKPDDIARIDVDTYIWAAQLDDDEPRNMLAAKFSLPFSLATTIVNGAASIAAFRDEARRDAVTLALAQAHHGARGQGAHRDAAGPSAGAGENHADRRSRSQRRSPHQQGRHRRSVQRGRNPGQVPRGRGIGLERCALFGDSGGRRGPRPIARPSRAVPSARGLIGGHDV